MPIGLFLGAVTQALAPVVDSIPTVGAYRDFVTGSLWLGGLLTLVWVLRLKLHPLLLGVMSALFWTATVLGYYGFYLTELAAGLGPPGTQWTVEPWGGLLWVGIFFKQSVLRLLVPVGLSGFGIGLVYGLIHNAGERKRISTV